MSEVEWRGRTVPVKIDKVRIFLLGLADNEAAIVQVRRGPWCSSVHSKVIFVRSGLKELHLWGRFTVTVMGKGALRGWLTTEGHSGAAGGAAVRPGLTCCSPPPCPQGHPSFLGHSQEPG